MQGSGAIGEVCAVCEGSNWIKIRYEFEDGTGVSGANYVVHTVAKDGPGTGVVLAEGTTDANGEAHVPLPDEHTEVQFYFHDDPGLEPYEDPEAARPLQEPRPGFWRGLWEDITDGADWIWGVLKGDFEEDPSTSQIIARMILTMIPGIDQLADVQDIANILYRLIWKQEWDVKMHWVLLVITLIGLIPVLGSLAKGVLKLVIKKAGDISALRALYGIFNYFKKGNAHRWLVNFAHDLTGTHLNTALGLLDGMMNRVVRHMTDSKGWFSSRWNRLIDEGLAKVAAFRTAAPAKLREAATYLQKQLFDTLRQSMSRTRRGSTRNAEPHVVKQQKVEPPKRISGLSDEKVREILDTPKGQRPDPSTYMTKAEIDEHLAKFDDGAVRVTPASAIDQYGTAGPPGGFVMPKSEFDAMVKEAGGDLIHIETRLGLDPGSLSNGEMVAVRIDPEDFSGLRVPSGNELGANNQWLPGGYTSGGAVEAVMDFDGVPFEVMKIGGQ
ncbi:MAG: hypothetical protein AAGH74_16580 [Pseudomonadota bacterium]